MIRGEVHPIAIPGISILFHVKISADIIRRLFAAGYAVHQMIEFPAVAHVECLFVQLGRLRFGQQKHRLDFLQFSPGPVPKIQGHHTGHITPETIDAHLSHPEFHGRYHILAQFPVIIIQVNAVGPVGNGRKEIPLGVSHIPIGMLHGQLIIPGSVVSHPVDDHVHAHLVDFVHQPFEIIQGSIFRIHGQIILDRIIAAQGALAPLFANRMNGHEPEDTNAQVL